MPLKYTDSQSPVKGAGANGVNEANLLLEVTRDERDAFLERENELSDQLAEKESQLLERDNTIANLQSIIDLNELRIAPAASVSLMKQLPKVA